MSATLARQVLAARASPHRHQGQPNSIAKLSHAIPDVAMLNYPPLISPFAVKFVKADAFRRSIINSMCTAV